MGPARLGQGVATGSAHVPLHAVLAVGTVREGEDLDSIIDDGDSFDFVHEGTIQLFGSSWGV